MTMMDPKNRIKLVLQCWLMIIIYSCKINNCNKNRNNLSFFFTFDNSHR